MEKSTRLIDTSQTRCAMINVKKKGLSLLVFKGDFRAVHSPPGRSPAARVLQNEQKERCEYSAMKMKFMVTVTWYLKFHI